jgi:hypothetical protein
LFPKLGDVGSKNFPGTVEVAYVVNAGWTQKGLWSVIQKVIPKTAVERIRFANSSKDLDEVFDLDRLPIGQFLSVVNPDANLVVSLRWSRSVDLQSG